MNQLTLLEFLAGKGRRTGHYVVWRPFRPIYVRKSRVVIDGEFKEQVFTIANIELPKRSIGKGHFSKLVKLLQAYKLGVYVECVNSVEFAEKLAHMGFRNVSYQNWYLEFKS